MELIEPHIRCLHNLLFIMFKIYPVFKDETIFTHIIEEEKSGTKNDLS